MSSRSRAPLSYVLALQAIACVQSPAPESPARESPSQTASAGPAKSRMRMGATRVDGRLAPEHVQLTVRAAQRELQLCYEQVAATSPELAGSVVVRFAVGSDGKVSSAEADPSSTLADAQVRSCVLAVFSGLSFAAPEDRRASVVYPIEFSPP